MDTLFHFTGRQKGILGQNGIAAYIQRLPAGQIGWIYANRLPLHEWQPTKWAFRCLRIQVTWDSFERVYADKFQYQPEWVKSGLMVTAFESFLTEEIESVERYFARFIDKPEFALWPDQVMLPMDLPRDRADDLVDPFYSVPMQLRRQKQAGSWLKKVGTIQQIGAPPCRITGRLSEVKKDGLVLVNANGTHQIPFPEEAELYPYCLDWRAYSWWIEEACRTVWNYQNGRWEGLPHF